MKIVSDGCICAKCLDKHTCKYCAMVSSVQKLADRYFAYESEDIQVVFQIEKCPLINLRS
jgi:cysteinyl-tRNA synthetase